MYVRNSWAVVVFFIVKSERKRWSRTNFEAEDLKENIRAIFVYIANQIEQRNIFRIFQILNTSYIFIPSLMPV